MAASILGDDVLGIFNETALWTCVSFVLWGLVFYHYHGLGITLGYHRLLTHKSLKVPKWLMYFIVSGGYLALMGSPIVWVGVHRLHHQKSDQDGDPHSPVHGFKHALYEWMYDMRTIQSDEELQAQVPDLMADPVLVWFGAEHSAWQAQKCLIICIAFRLLILALFGWVAFAASIVGTAVLFWSTQLVNAVCHVPSAGYRRHQTREFSTNVWWVGLLALGEGWHNNHHAVPKSAHHGFAWFEFDETWYAIWLLEKLGLATNVIRAPESVAHAPIIKETPVSLANIIMQPLEPAAEPVLAEKV